jgi:hypothetical protein
VDLLSVSLLMAAFAGDDQASLRRKATIARTISEATKPRMLTRTAQRIDNKPRGIAPPRSSSLKRLSPDSTAFDSVSYLTTVFIVLLGGELMALLNPTE